MVFCMVLIISKFFTQVPVLRSRPKIAEPHVRTVSFPAESTARLVCESEGKPKPFITWTKVATGRQTTAVYIVICTKKGI